MAEEKNRQQVFTTIGSRLVAEIRQSMEDLNLNASGETSESVKFNITRDTLRVTADENFVFIQDGVGRGPGKFPPIDKIKDWIGNKNIQSDLSLNSLAFLIGRKIANEGTAIFRKERPGVNLKAILNNSLQITLTKFEKAIALEFDSDINKSIRLGQQQ